MSTIDLNADLGEGVGDDTAMLAIVSSASVACGGHAGDATTIEGTLRAAKANNVRVGAHPGFADKVHFGRKRLDVSLAEINGQVGDQLDLFRQIADSVGMAPAYVKLHGALSNMAAEDEAVARAAFEAVAARWPGLPILALAASAQVAAARSLDLPVIAEAYADRAYTADGQLADRSLPGAVLHDAETIVARCLRLADKGEIETIDGQMIPSDARSICLHGDNPGAVTFARAVRAALEAAGLTISAG